MTLEVANISAFPASLEDKRKVQTRQSGGLSCCAPATLAPDPRLSRRMSILTQEGDLKRELPHTDDENFTLQVRSQGGAQDWGGTRCQVQACRR